MSEELEPLYPPQALAIERGVQLKGRCPVLGAMGSGKTRVALGIYEQLNDWRNAKEPTAICCGTNAFPTWFNQLQKWLGVPPDHIAVAEGNPQERAKAWYSGAPFVISTYASYVNDGKRGVVPRDLNFIGDEYHKVARTRTKTWETLCTWTLHSDIVLLTTGTPMRRGPQDLWPALHMCDRRGFSSYWKFVKIWCLTQDDGFGHVEIIGPRNIENFRRHIYAGHCAYMPKKETDKYLPQKNRIFIPIIPSKFQRKQIDSIETQMFLERHTDDRLVLTPNRMSQILRERQILCTPKLIDPVWEFGTGILTLLEKLDECSGVIPRPVVFTDFAGAVPIIAEAIREQSGQTRKVWELVGGTKREDLDQTVKTFNASEDDALVCSLQYAESFEFPRSQNCYVLGFPWVADQCEQAEDRLRRAISEYKNITAYYFQYQGTIEGYMLSIIRRKGENVRKVTPDDIEYALEASHKAKRQMWLV